jgi:hypothetical protein
VRGEMHTSFWWGELREGNHFEDPGVDGSIIQYLFNSTSSRVK